MKKYIKCDKCYSLINTNIVCDTCGEICEFHEIGETALILKINDSEYHFCNYSCLLKFILEELKKEK